MAASALQKTYAVEQLQATVKFQKAVMDEIDTDVQAMDPGTVMPTAAEIQAQVDALNNLDRSFGGDDSFAAVAQEVAEAV